LVAAVAGTLAHHLCAGRVDAETRNRLFKLATAGLSALETGNDQRSAAFTFATLNH
jgi:hypothetical protein